MLWLAGVTAIETSAGALTVSIVESDTPPNVAVIVVVPSATDVASPAPLMVAIPADDEVHVAKLVRFCVAVGLDNVPVAVNCCVVPRAMTGLSGVTAIEVTADVVSWVCPITLPNAAVIVVVPVAEAAVTSPGVSSKAATVLSEESHITKLERFCLAPFCNVPVAKS